MRSALGTVVLLAGALLVGCGSTPAPQINMAAAARSVWTASGLRDYHFIYETVCFCPPEDPILVTVRAGKVVAGAYVTTHEPVSAARLSTLLSVDDLFTKLDAAHARPAHTVQVTFDRRYGYPTSLYIDWDVMIADEEIEYRVSDLVPD
jgi:hypothetical protein